MFNQPAKSWQSQKNYRAEHHCKIGMNFLGTASEIWHISKHHVELKRFKFQNNDSNSNSENSSKTRSCVWTNTVVLTLVFLTYQESKSKKIDWNYREAPPKPNYLHQIAAAGSWQYRITIMAVKDWRARAHSYRPDSASTEDRDVSRDARIRSCITWSALIRSCITWSALTTED